MVERRLDPLRLVLLLRPLLVPAHSGGQLVPPLATGLQGGDPRPQPRSRSSRRTKNTSKLLSVGEIALNLLLAQRVEGMDPRTRYVLWKRRAAVERDHSLRLRQVRCRHLSVRSKPNPPLFRSLDKKDSMMECKRVVPEDHKTLSERNVKGAQFRRHSLAAFE